MSADTVDALHAAEDLIGQLTAALEEAWARLDSDAQHTADGFPDRVLVAIENGNTFCRCEHDDDEDPDDRECCGCPCHNREGGE